MTLDGALPLAAASDLLAARQQMAFTLGFHIVLASFGVAFPFITLVANYRGLRGDGDAMLLARRWSKVMAVLFAVGAVTGTVLSFEMGLLWPGLMGHYGDAFGVPFAIEGIFFFTEAIFIAIYIYGWRRLPGWAHFWTGVPIVISGLGGALAVVAANSWMNQPGGFTVQGGRIVDVDPLSVVFNAATPYEVPHMILAAYLVTGFTLASVYAVGMLRGRTTRYHRVGFAIPFVVAAVLAPVQFLVGDTAARAIAKDQPIKFAAMEYVTTTSTNVPEYIGGVYDKQTGDVKWGIEIPDLDSILVDFSPDAKVIGLDTVPEADRPANPTLIHLAFDTMVGIGTAIMGLGLWALVAFIRRRSLPRSRWFLRLSAISGAAVIVAMWCGWIVTEVGRQPWIVYNRFRVADAVTGATGIGLSLVIVIVLYIALGITTAFILRTMARRWRAEEEAEVEHDVPYGPPPPVTLTGGSAS